MKFHKNIRISFLLLTIILAILFTQFSPKGFTEERFNSSVKTSKENLSGTPTINEIQKLLASDGTMDDGLGGNIDMDGDTLIVGASKADIGPNADEGAAYIFVKNGDTWTEQAKLTSPMGDPDDQFGFNVAINGDTAVVCARFEDVLNATDNKGAVHVYVRSGTTWSHQQTLTVSIAGTSPQDQLGHGVSIDGDTIVAGAPRESSDRGGAYVFVRSGTTWTEQQKLIPSDTLTPGFQYGHSTSVSGDTAVVTATRSFLTVGSAYVFVRSGTTWTEQQKIDRLRWSNWKWLWKWRFISR